MAGVKRIGLLTAGGDCPGLNAAIRAVVKCSVRQNPPLEVLGFKDGYAGLVLNNYLKLTDASVSGLISRGGTMLGTSRGDNPLRFQMPGEKRIRNRLPDVFKTIRRHRLEGIICVGGDGTLSCALELSRRGVKIIGIPKTIDNDLSGTDVTFGFDSAVAVATDAVERLHTTAESHHRILICEVMGRHAGWIALHAGMAGGGDVILIPEIPYDIRKVCGAIQERAKRGKNFTIIVVAEGAKPKDGRRVTQGRAKTPDHRLRLGGISHVIAQQLEKMTGDETRVVILGHLQRGGSPTPFDRWLATRFGVHAVELVQKGLWGNMVTLRGVRIEHVDIAQAVGRLHLVDPFGQAIEAARQTGASFGD